MTRFTRDGRLGRRRFLTAAAAGAGLLLPAGYREMARAQDSTPAAGDGPLGQITAPDVRKYEGATINLAVQKHSATDAIEALKGDFEAQTGIVVNFEQIPQQQMDQK